MEDYQYCNYRCRKCGDLISMKKHFDPYRSGQRGCLFRNNEHSCKEGIEEGEAVLADFVSVSHEPLKDAEVIE